MINLFELSSPLCPQCTQFEFQLVFSAVFETMFLLLFCIQLCIISIIGNLLAVLGIFKNISKDNRPITKFLVKKSLNFLLTLFLILHVHIRNKILTENEICNLKLILNNYRVSINNQYQSSFTLFPCR